MPFHTLLSCLFLFALATQYDCFAFEKGDLCNDAQYFFCTGVILAKAPFHFRGSEWKKVGLVVGGTATMTSGIYGFGLLFNQPAVRKVGRYGHI